MLGGTNGGCQVLAHPWVSGDIANEEFIHEDVFNRFEVFNARRKFRGTVYASIVRTKFQLRTKYLKELVGDRVLSEAELHDLRENFVRLYVISLENSGSCVVFMFQFAISNNCLMSLVGN